MRGNGVGQTAGIVNAADRGQDFGWNFFVQFDVLVKLLHHRAAQGLDFAAGLRGHHFDGRDMGSEV